jgi:transposase InsO family protein
VVIDLFSRQVIGWSLRVDMAGSIVIAAARAVGPRQRDSLLRR